MFGDYDFLGMIYGISGASGKHPCLWCTATTEDIRLHPAKRKEQSSLRTLDTIKEDLKKFRTTFKSNLARAKDANNVIDEPMFDIPLDQV